MTTIDKELEKEFFDNLEENLSKADIAFKAYERGRNDALDKIRERISLEKFGYPPSAGYYKAIVKVLKIIDHYKNFFEAESEDNI